MSGHPVLAIVGPTGTGKSDVGVELAVRLDGEVVNADASQLYRGMDIGTAKLSPPERREVVHHQLDVLDITATASVAAYQRAARAAVQDIGARGRVPILVGGSGLYVKAVLDPLHFPGTDAAVRARVEAEVASLGPAAAHRLLTERDPLAASHIHPSNQRRVVRALEVIELTGQPFSASLPRDDYVRPTVQVGLRRDRQELDEALGSRVHSMMAAGLLAEVEALTHRGLRAGRTARTALGYAQLLSHLDGATTLEQAVDDTIAATRAFARRQVKWFRRDARITWLNAPADPAALGSLADEAEKVLRAAVYS